MIAPGIDIVGMIEFWLWEIIAQHATRSLSPQFAIITIELNNIKFLWYVFSI